MSSVWIGLIATIATAAYYPVVHKLERAYLDPPQRLSPTKTLHRFGSIVRAVAIGISLFFWICLPIGMMRSGHSIAVAGMAVAVLAVPAAISITWFHTTKIIVSSTDITRAWLIKRVTLAWNDVTNVYMRGDSLILRDRYGQKIRISTKCIQGLVEIAHAITSHLDWDTYAKAYARMEEARNRHQPLERR